MSKKNIWQRLTGILRGAYNHQDTPQAGPQWKTDTMDRIRRLALETPPAGFTLMFEQFVWRLTPVAGALTIIGFFVLIRVNFIPDSAVFQLLMNDAEEYRLLTHFVL